MIVFTPKSVHFDLKKCSFYPQKVFTLTSINGHLEAKNAVGNEGKYGENGDFEAKMGGMQLAEVAKSLCADLRVLHFRD